MRREDWSGIVMQKNHSRQISVAIFKVEAVQRGAPGKYMHAHQINSNVLACKLILSLLANSGYVSGRYEVECCRLIIFHFYYLLYCCFCYFAVVIVCIPVVASYDVVGFFFSRFLFFFFCIDVDVAAVVIIVVVAVHFVVTVLPLQDNDVYEQRYGSKNTDTC